MAISASLISKGIAGTLALSAPVATSIYYKDSIYELFVPKKTIQESGEEESKPEDGTWTITDEENSKIKITYPKNKSCSLNITSSGSGTSNISTIKQKIEGLIGKDNLTEKHRRYRRGLIEGCGNNNTSSNLTVNDENNIDLSTLFYLKKEKLNEKEKALASQEWSDPTGTVDSNKLKITVTVVATSETTDSEISVNSCDIVGSKSSVDSEEINSDNLNSSKDDIVTSIKNKIKENSNKEPFLIKCKQSYNNEIKLDLKKKDNKYELEGLDGIFTSSQKTQ